MIIIITVSFDKGGGRGGSRLFLTIFSGEEPPDPPFITLIYDLAPPNLGCCQSPCITISISTVITMIIGGYWL